jgi:hypothetical protein
MTQIKNKHGKIVINLAYQDGQMATLLTVMGDELSHYVDAKVGRPTSLDDPRRQDISTFYGDNAGEQAQGPLGTERVGAEAFQNGLKGLDFKAVNDEVANTEGMERRVVVHSRSVDLSKPADDIGRHLFIEVDPNDYDPTGKTRYISLDGKFFGGIAEVNTDSGFPNDQKAINEGRIKESQVIEVPKGMSEQEFDNQVIQVAEQFDATLPENQYPIFGGALNGKPNSNTFVDNVIENAGGKIKNFDKALNQNDGE